MNRADVLSSLAPHAAVNDDEWDVAQRNYWSGVAPIYDTLYRTQWSHREDKWVQSRLSFIRQLGNPTVLDLGCGTGLGARLTQHWNCGAHYIGVDISPEMIASTAQTYGVKCVLGSMDHLTWVADDSIDVVLALFSSASFARSPENLLAEIHRILKPGGHGYISTLSHRRTSKDIDMYITRAHVDSAGGTPAHHYRARELAALARSMGFVEVKIRGMNALAGLYEDPRLWWLGRAISMVRADWSHLLELDVRKP